MARPRLTRAQAAARQRELATRSEANRVSHAERLAARSTRSDDFASHDAGLAPHDGLRDWKRASELRRAYVSHVRGTWTCHLVELSTPPRMGRDDQVIPGVVDFETHGVARTRDQAIEVAFEWWSRRAELEPAQDAEREMEARR